MISLLRVARGPEVVISHQAEQIIEGFGGAFTESSATVYGTEPGPPGKDGEIYCRMM